MPTNSQQFFEEQKQASQYKVKLLGDYALPFFYKLGSQYRTVWIVDGFAGPGRYDDGETGSPVATAAVAAKVAPHQSQLRVINVERDPALFSRLEESVAHAGPLTVNLPGKFSARIADIIQIIGDDPALFFIDPFGMTGTDIRLIDEILARKARTVTELLIHFSYRGFQRMAGNLTFRPRSPARQQAAETKVRQLDAMLGSPVWQGIWTNSALSSAEKCERVAELFATALRARGIDHVHPIKMRDDYHGPTRYELLFATRSSHGVYLMSDQVCRYERALPGADLGDQLSLMGASSRRASRPSRSDLRDRVYEVGLAQRRGSLQQLQRIISPEFFGFFTEKDYADALRELIRMGLISRETDRGLKPREELRFVASPTAGRKGGLGASAPKRSAS